MDYTAPICSNARIMIADNPAPIVARGQLPQQPGGFILQPCLSAIVMEIVAQAVNRLNRIFACQPRQFFKRRPAVIGWEELPAHRIAGRLFKVQVSDQQRLARRPVKRRLTDCFKAMSAKGNLRCHSRCYGQCAMG